MILIFESSGVAGGVIHIAGSLKERHLAELQRVARDGAKDFALDLSDLQNADHECARWLKMLADDGVKIIGATSYIALVIDRAEPEPQVQPEGTR